MQDANKKHVEASNNQQHVDAMGAAEDELKDINRSFQTGALNAFGTKEASILKQIDTISQLQVRAFLASMELELKYPNVVNMSTATTSKDEKKKKQDDKQQQQDDYADFEEDSFAKVSKAFQEKEKAISKLVQDLQSISKSIDSINNDLSST